jgi:hypothetical protein
MKKHRAPNYAHGAPGTYRAVSGVFSPDKYLSLIYPLIILLHNNFSYCTAEKYPWRIKAGSNSQFKAIFVRIRAAQGIEAVSF